jgi:glycosyltransferase involved in cell wall biosynthesis
MKKVLMIAPYFVPRRRVGAMRPFKFAIHLREYGWDPVVLTIHNSYDHLSELEKKLVEGIEIIRLTSPFDRTAAPGKDKGKHRKSSHSASVTDQIAEWIDRHIPTDSWIFLLKLKYLSILKSAKQTAPDLIWSTGDPWSGLWLGEKLSDDLNVPLLADFRDPWTLADVQLRNRSPFSMELDRQIEKRVVERADKLIFTSKATEEKYSEHYHLSSQKTATIYNAFDRILLEEQGEPWQDLSDPDKLHLIFFGRFRRLSPAEPIINALQHLQHHRDKSLQDIKIHSFGRPDIEDEIRIKDLQLTDQFVFHEPMLPEKASAVLEQADILLVSTNRERKNIIPAKLWDYMAADKPILSIAPNPEISRILEMSGAGVQLNPDSPEAIANLLAQCAGKKRKGDHFALSSESNINDRSIFSAEHTTGQLTAIFDELIKHG